MFLLVWCTRSSPMKWCVNIDVPREYVRDFKKNTHFTIELSDFETL